ncbi:S-layer homology domain-containing protein [Candidatus Peregrinibacteria bacterium]|nr:MAG: S-layer homology domain-containing protein [Candidatus Peregrinibacteria bacterium]
MTLSPTPMHRYFFTILLLAISFSLPLALSTQEAKQQVELATLPPTDTDIADEEPDENPARPPLTDIQGHWAETQINNLYQTQVINGYGDGTFGPNDPVTRTQFLIIALRAFHYEAPDENYADFAHSIGLINNLDYWKNHGDAHVTRAEALKILLNAGSLTVGDELSPNFPDVDIVNDWFAVYSAFGKAQGIVTGDVEGNFNGNQNVSRAETCALTLRIMERLPSEIEG